MPSRSPFLSQGTHFPAAQGVGCSWLTVSCSYLMYATLPGKLLVPQPCPVSPLPVIWSWATKSWGLLPRGVTDRRCGPCPRAPGGPDRSPSPAEALGESRASGPRTPSLAARARSRCGASSELDVTDLSAFAGLPSEEGGTQTAPFLVNSSVTTFNMLIFHLLC